MIRQIDNSEQATPQPTSSVQPATSAGKSFAAVLSHQQVADKEAIKTPEGEEWKPVTGHDHYAKITQGPRAGKYINLSRGARRGQVFTIEVRNGQKVHVYGEGDKQVVVGASKDSGHVKANVHLTAAQRRPKKETWAPVEGANNYADILSGPRNGLYVNTSGGVRDGMAFQIVKHGDKLFHIYGKGKHRQVIEVSAPKKPSDTQSNQSTGASATTDTTGATGSTADATGGASPDQ